MAVADWMAGGSSEAGQPSQRRAREAIVQSVSGTERLSRGLIKGVEAAGSLPGFRPEIGSRSGEWMDSLHAILTQLPASQG
jgi:hypothetical protein